MDLTSETKGKATIELFVNGKSVKKDTVKFKQKSPPVRVDLSM